MDGRRKTNQREKRKEKVLWSHFLKGHGKMQVDRCARRRGHEVSVSGEGHKAASLAPPRRQVSLYTRDNWARCPGMTASYGALTLPPVGALKHLENGE